jgi:hypothetical protein
LALQMGTHNRLGADSPILCLTPCLLMWIWTMVYADQYTQAELKVWHEDRRVAWRNHNHLDDCWAYCAWACFVAARGGEVWLNCKGCNWTSKQLNFHRNSCAFNWYDLSLNGNCFSLNWND